VNVLLAIKLSFTLHRQTCVPMVMMDNFRLTSTCSYTSRNVACECVRAKMCTSMESFIMD